ncbi:hypothetical protein PR048_020711 [Dryococelus australis]|uniref:Uncharacterized protein n=1 Tax=Dryococelus australis TaxID=614101 RepID=A0ABQ9H7H9_9NEOP|nr:hypothetical protein PR048_020711 [Dryococelus australis]
MVGPDNKEDERKILQEKLFSLVKARLVSVAEQRTMYHKVSKLNKSEIGALVLRCANPVSSVLGHIIKKLIRLYEGPFKVKAVINNNCYALGTLDGKEVGSYNITQLRTYKVPCTQP